MTANIYQMRSEHAPISKVFCLKMKGKLLCLSLNYKYNIFKNNLTLGNNCRLREKLQRDFPFIVHSASFKLNIYITTVHLSKLRNNLSFFSRCCQLSQWRSVAATAPNPRHHVGFLHYISLVSCDLGLVFLSFFMIMKLYKSYWSDIL